MWRICWKSPEVWRSALLRFEIRGAAWVAGPGTPKSFRNSAERSPEGKPLPACWNGQRDAGFGGITRCGIITICEGQCRKTMDLYIGTIGVNRASFKSNMLVKNTRTGGRAANGNRL